MQNDLYRKLQQKIDQYSVGFSGDSLGSRNKDSQIPVFRKRCRDLFVA